MKACFLSATLLAAVMEFPIARADEWPQFRGPTGQGLAAGQRLPIKWSPSQNIVWKQAIPGRGWSSPIIWGGKVYLTTAVAQGGRSLQALCLSAESGKILWQREVFRPSGAPQAHSKNSQASPTPVTDGLRLYAHFGHEGTACLDFGGNLIWKNTDLKYEPRHGNGGSPIVVNGVLVFSVDGTDRQFVAGLDARSGKVVWKTDRKTEAAKSFSFGTPLAIAVNGRTQIVSQGSEVVAAYDPISGREIWRVGYEGYSVVPRPVFGHGLVFVCTGYEQPKLLAIRPDGQGDVTNTHIAWQSSRNVSLTPSPLVVGDELYLIADGGIASCLDARSGRVHWQKRIGGNHSASPIHANGRIYFQDEDGNGTVIKAGTTFEEVAKNSLGERSLASYAVSGEALFLRTEEHLYRIQER